MSRTHIWLPLLLVVSFVFLAASQIGSETDSSVFFLDGTMQSMVELSLGHPVCKKYRDRGDIQRRLLQSDPRRIRLVPRYSIRHLDYVCRLFDWHDIHDLISNDFSIFPGTKWCGAGNIAADYNDLGRHVEEDRCCREHDHCANPLVAGECRGDICNKSDYTISHCGCDARLRRCLSSVNTWTATKIGFLFFTFVESCFQERRPCSVYQKPTECALEIRPAKPYLNVNGGKWIWGMHADVMPFLPPKLHNWLWHL